MQRGTHQPAHHRFTAAHTLKSVADDSRSGSLICTQQTGQQYPQVKHAGALSKLPASHSQTHQSHVQDTCPQHADCTSDPAILPGYHGHIMRV